MKNKVNVTCVLNAYPEDVTFYWTHHNSSSNSSWTTSQDSHTILELQESKTELYCWGRNEVGMQMSPCRMLLAKSIFSPFFFLFF